MTDPKLITELAELVRFHTLASPQIAIAPGTRLADDLGADSFALVCIIFAVRAQYGLAADPDPAAIGSLADLAAYVEQKMLLAAKESPAGDTLKIAVLAALNIADECFRAREEGTAQRTGVSQRARELEQMLDLALAGAEPLARAAGSH